MILKIDELSDYRNLNYISKLKFYFFKLIMRTLNSELNFFK